MRSRLVASCATSSCLAMHAANIVVETSFHTNSPIDNNLDIHTSLCNTNNDLRL